MPMPKRLGRPMPILLDRHISARIDELVLTAEPVESTILDPFEIAKLDTNRSRQVDANATRH